MSTSLTRRALAFSAALFLHVNVAMAQAAPALPEGRAGDAVRAYLAAIESRDSTRILSWLKRYDPEGDMTVRTGRQLALARRTGGFIVERVTRGEPNAVEAILRERSSGDRIRFELVLDSNGVAESFGLEPISGDAGGPPAPAPARSGT